MGSNFVRGRIWGGAQQSGPGGGGGGSGEDIIFNADKPITRDTPGIQGVNLGTDTVLTTLEALLFPAVAPGASLSVNDPIREVGATTAFILSWEATENTNPITGITVNGTDIDPTGSTQSGTQDGEAAGNTQATYTYDMTDTDGSLTGSASCTLQYLPRVFWGTLASNAAPTDAQILGLQNSALQANFDLNLSNFGGGATYLCFAWPSSFGVPKFIINGLTNTAFTCVRASSNFVNAEGATIVMDVYTSNNLYNSALGTVEVTAS